MASFHARISSDGHVCFTSLAALRKLCSNKVLAVAVVRDCFVGLPLHEMACIAFDSEALLKDNSGANAPRLHSSDTARASWNSFVSLVAFTFGTRGKDKC